MVFILLTRKSYHCLHRCLDFDPKSKSFKGDLKFGYQDFSVKFNNCFETSYDQWFSVLWRHTASWSVLCKWSYFYNIFLILDFSQGCISFGDMPCAFIHFFFTRHKTKTRKDGMVVSMSFSFMLEKRNVCIHLPSQAFVKWGGKSSPQPRWDLNVVILSSSGHFWMVQIPSHTHTCASPFSAHFH